MPLGVLAARCERRQTRGADSRGAPPRRRAGRRPRRARRRAGHRTRAPRARPERRVVVGARARRGSAGGGRGAPGVRRRRSPRRDDGELPGLLRGVRRRRGRSRDDPPAAAAVGRTGAVGRLGIADRRVRGGVRRPVRRGARRRVRVHRRLRADGRRRGPSCLSPEAPLGARRRESRRARARDDPLPRRGRGAGARGRRAGRARVALADHGDDARRSRAHPTG